MPRRCRSQHDAEYEQGEAPDDNNGDGGNGAGGEGKACRTDHNQRVCDGADAISSEPGEVTTKPEYCARDPANRNEIGTQSVEVVGELTGQIAKGFKSLREADEVEHRGPESPGKKCGYGSCQREEKGEDRPSTAEAQQDQATASDKRADEPHHRGKPECARDAPGYGKNPPQNFDDPIHVDEATSMRRGILELADGRDLCWTEVGDPDAVPVFRFHGTPGSGRSFVSASDAVASGVRLISPDRPGYGHSTFHRKRTFANWSDDVAVLADYLEIDRFAVFGISGGGPHAAACARFLADRLIGVGIVSGVGPLGELRTSEGMTATSRVLTALCRSAPWLLRLPITLLLELGRRFPERALELQIKALPQPDQEILNRPEIWAEVVAEARRAAPTTAKAMAQDYRLFATDWGFALSDIDVDVHLWQGDVDRQVPESHARFQAERLGKSVLHECPGEGHFLVVDHHAEILATITGA